MPYIKALFCSALWVSAGRVLRLRVGCSHCPRLPWRLSGNMWSLWPALVRQQLCRSNRTANVNSDGRFSPSLNSNGPKKVQSKNCVGSGLSLYNNVVKGSHRVGQNVKRVQTQGQICFLTLPQTQCMFLYGTKWVSFQPEYEKTANGHCKYMDFFP